MEKKPTFKHDNNVADFKNMLELAKKSPCSLTMKEMEREAENYLRDMQAKYGKMDLEDLARDQGEKIVRKEEDTFFYTNCHDVTEIWELFLTEMEFIKWFQFYQKHGDRKAISALFSPELFKLCVPHQMLYQKYRQLVRTSDSQGVNHIFVFWSDVKLPEVHKDFYITSSEEYDSLSNRVSGYFVPTAAYNTAFNQGVDH